MIRYTTKNSLRLFARGLILAFFLYMYIFDKEGIISFVNIGMGKIRIYHIVWLYLIFEMLTLIIPKLNPHISTGKNFKKYYNETQEYAENEIKLREFIKKGNIAAIVSAILWILLLAIIGTLYYLKIISKLDLYLFSVLFFFCDQICVNIWCPFRMFIVKAKCCSACRIYNWDHFMYYSPLIFFYNFWNFILIFFSLIILFQWEYFHYKNPERFYEYSNENIRCSHCIKKNNVCTKYGKVPWLEKVTLKIYNNILKK